MANSSSIISGISDAVLRLGTETRFCSVVDSIGKILYFRYREDVPELFFPEIEVEKDMVQAIAKMQTNERKTNLLGHVKYCVISFEKIVRAIIPFEEFFALISFDGSTSNLDSLIREQVIPLLISRRSTLA
jgi:hypothetical protein